MSELVIIAGPQAAGKSTVISRLSEQYQGVSPLFPHKRKFPTLFPLQESRQIIVHKWMLLGAILMSSRDEREIVECDLDRMDMLLSRRRERHLVYIDECNVFTVAHARAHNATEIEQYWEAYISRLARLNAKVVFLDVPPKVSWERRKSAYERRLVYFPKKEHASLMRRYREYLENIHPLLHEVYRNIPFPKKMIVANSSEQGTLQQVNQALAYLSGTFRF